MKKPMRDLLFNSGKWLVAVIVFALVVKLLIFSALAIEKCEDNPIFQKVDCAFAGTAPPSCNPTTCVSGYTCIDCWGEIPTKPGYETSLRYCCPPTPTPTPPPCCPPCGYAGKLCSGSVLWDCKTNADGTCSKTQTDCGKLGCVDPPPQCDAFCATPTPTPTPIPVYPCYNSGVGYNIGASICSERQNQAPLILTCTGKNPNLGGWDPTGFCYIGEKCVQTGSPPDTTAKCEKIPTPTPIKL